MSQISDIIASAKTQTNQINETSNNTSKTSGTSKVKGKTIGSPQLSEKASKYYEELKKKYSNMDFILVSEDQKANAQAQAGNYANANKTVVLIDEDKIERMAEDSQYRKQYEGIISGAANKLAQMSGSLAAAGANVKTYGMQVNDNGAASFFAVMKKSFSSQNEKLSKRIADKRTEKKAAEKKAQKKEAEEKLKKGRADKADVTDTEETVTVTASSVESLIQKINDMMLAERSDQVQTDEEKLVGQNMDYSI
ncbi:MAG: DUF6033 family protein [bacterium]|nr:DUF6033 family protein [bacterium]